MTNPSPLRYPGGKQRAVSRILPLIPEGTKTLYSPFFGGGSVELAWAAENPDGQVIGRDIFKPLVNFWKVALSNRCYVAADVAKSQFYPLEREMFYNLQKLLRNGKAVLDVNDAARFFTVNRASFSGATLSGGMGTGDRFSLNAINKLRRFKAPNVKVRKADAFDFLRRRIDKFKKEDAFIFLDPPYYLGTASKLYGNQGDTHTGFDHRRLRDILTMLDNEGVKWMMTYNNCPDIHKLYRDFRRQPSEWKYGMSTNKNGKELFIFSNSMSRKN